MKKRGSLDFSFQWIFAIIIGVFILVGAIYLSTKFIHSEGVSSSAEKSKDFSSLLNPLESSFESSKSILLKTPLETKIENICYKEPNLGKQKFAFDQKIYEKWQDDSLEVSSNNNYVFSDREIQGQNFYATSYYFEFPFKITNLIYLTSSKNKYCFFDDLGGSTDLLKEMNQSNLRFGNCLENDIIICSKKDSCDIYVNLADKEVIKDDKKVYYEGDALMFAAIFSDAEIYECQVYRLVQRVKTLTQIYKEKSLLYAECSSDIYLYLDSLLTLTKEYSSSKDLTNFVATLNDLDYKNKKMDCELW